MKLTIRTNKEELFDEEMFENLKSVTVQVKELKKNEDFCYGKGCIFMKNSQYELAIEDFLEYLKVNPKHARVYYDLALCYEEIGKFEEAVEGYTKAIDLNVNNKEKAYCFRGNVKSEKLGDVAGAIEDFTKALELNPAFYVALASRGMTYYSNKMYEKAIEDSLELISFGDKASDHQLFCDETEIEIREYSAICILCDSYIELGDWENSRKWFGEGMKRIIIADMENRGDSYQRCKEFMKLMKKKIESKQFTFLCIVLWCFGIYLTILVLGLIFRNCTSV